MLEGNHVTQIVMEKRKTKVEDVLESENQEPRMKVVENLANLPACLSRKPSDLHTVRGTPRTWMGTVRLSKGISLARATCELNGQAGSIEIRPI